MKELEFYISNRKYDNIHQYLQVNDNLDLYPELDKDYNINAIRLDFRGVKIGYIPSDISRHVSTAIGMGKDLICTVTELNSGWEQCKVKILRKE